MKNGLRKKLAIICAHASSVVRKGRGEDLPPLLGGTSPLFSGDLLPGIQATWEVDKRGGRSPQKGGGGPPRNGREVLPERGGEEVLWKGGVQVKNAGGRRV